MAIRTLPLSRPDDFEQELQNLDVPLRVGDRPAPRVEAVTAEQDARAPRGLPASASRSRPASRAMS